MEKIINLLKYKKQIILQGPPGTGKTRLAKEIARELASLSYKDIPSFFSSGDSIMSYDGSTNFNIDSVEEDSIVLTGDDIESTKISFAKIFKYYNSQRWLKENNNGDEREPCALAYHLYKIVGENDKHIKVLQFHPSYTYEDFVRGIVSKPSADGGGLIYEAEDKTLGKFAKEALESFNNSKMSNSSISKLKWVSPLFEEFVKVVKNELDDGKKYLLNPNVKITAITEDAFKYTGVEEWKSEVSLKFKDIIQTYVDDDKGRSDIKNNPNLTKSAREHATYIKAILDKFKDYISGKTIPDFSNSTSRNAIKNYVLIIDEINRANLSSVLGELMYALEYRGEAVESMYTVEGDNKLTLPPNLYIIGTMNTADRSVGHIDYAIRRRFAFVDVLPKDLSTEKGIVFNSKLFNEVSKLFDNYLSPEFEKKDVQLGHSYFIDKSEEGGSMDIRLRYEIKPILLEYVKDGILIGENIKQKVEQLNLSN